MIDTIVAVDVALWIAQGFLTFAFLASSWLHAVRWEQTSADPRQVWLRDIGRRNAYVIGTLEAAGAVGVIAPAVTGILPILVPLAATGLTLLMLSAMVFHAVRREYPNLVLNAILAAPAIFVAYGRFVLVPF